VGVGPDVLGAPVVCVPEGRPRSPAASGHPGRPAWAGREAMGGRAGDCSEKAVSRLE
jgi:hypothetical protein